MGAVVMASDTGAEMSAGTVITCEEKRTVIFMSDFDL